MPADKIPTELGGPENWEYKYIEPVAGENDRMKDTATRDRLQAQRNVLVQDFVNNTIEWIQAGADQAREPAIKQQRKELADKLFDSYWDMDPYLRARSLFDRLGMMDGPKIDMYSTQDSRPASAAKPSTAVNDVD